MSATATQCKQNEYKCVVLRRYLRTYGIWIDAVCEIPSERIPKIVANEIAAECILF